MNAQVASLLMLAATLGLGSADTPSTSISLVLACESSRRMTATIRNIGSDDTAVIFGGVLGNGAKYLVDDMTLQVTSTDRGGRVDQYSYRPKHYPSGIAGRLDDWIVPLPVGASYTLRLDSTDFCRHDGRLYDLPQGAHISLRLRTRGPSASPNSDVAGLRPFRVWTENSPLASNEIATQNCR